MTGGEASDIMYQFFVLCVQLAGPMLIISMLVGVVISVFQAATQIHEQTLSFVPKLLVIGIILVLRGNTMLEAMQEFFKQVLALLVG